MAAAEAATVDTEVVSRPVTVLVATVTLIVAMMTMILGMQQTTVHYSLPTPTGVSRHSVVYAPGVFAAGDVRLDSMKRVASAVGEGAMAIHLVHRYLATI